MNNHRKGGCTFARCTSGEHIRGYRGIYRHLLVLSHTQLHSGGIDVHDACPGAAQFDGGSGFAELHLAILLPDHRSRDRRPLDRDPEGHPSPRAVAIRLRLDVLVARHASLHIAVVEPRPPVRGSGIMNRNFYFIGIAFFGMINGLFNQLWLIFALLYVQPLVGPLLFGSLSLTLIFASLMVSTATVILGGIPAAIYERITGASESNNVSLWIWLAGTAILALPAAGNFIKIGL